MWHNARGVPVSGGCTMTWKVEWIRKLKAMTTWCFLYKMIAFVIYLFICFLLLGWLDCRRTHRYDYVPFCCSVRYTKLDRIQRENNLLGHCSVLVRVELCLHCKLQPRGDLHHKHIFLTCSYVLWLIFSLCVWPKALRAIRLVVFRFNNLHLLYSSS